MMDVMDDGMLALDNIPFPIMRTIPLLPCHALAFVRTRGTKRKTATAFTWRRLPPIPIQLMMMYLTLSWNMWCAMNVAVAFTAPPIRVAVEYASKHRLYSSDTASSSQSTTIPTLPETSPLPPHTFAGMVEQGLLERFGNSNVNAGDSIDRVLTSWRLLDRDYVHKAYVGDAAVDPSNSKCHQLCNSYVPGLTVREFWDTSDFDWCQKLKSKYKAIRDEFLRVTADMEELQAVGNNIWAGALSADASSYGEGWKTLVLMNRGMWDPVNVNLFPVTSKAVHDAGIPATEVFFASMQPNSSIQPHSDFTNFVLTSHLAVDIPNSGENKCRLSVGDTERQWINGEVMLFDTSIMHDAVNESDETRYILMLRVWHPELSELERQALQFTFNALEVPDIVSADPQTRSQAERIIEASLSFPEIKKGSNRKVGFGAPSGMPKKAKKSTKR